MDGNPAKFTQKFSTSAYCKACKKKYTEATKRLKVLNGLESMKKTSLKVKAQTDTVQAAKRLIFLVSTPLAVICLLFLWGVSFYIGELAWLDQYAYPIMAYFFCFIFVLLWSKLISIKSFGYFTYCLTFIYFSIKIYTVLQGAIFDGTQIESNFLLWIPFIYILGFSLLDIRRALVGSLIFFILIASMGVIILVQSDSIGVNPHNFYLLIELYLASMFYVIILYMMSYIREYYINSQMMSDVNSKLAMTDSLTMMDNRRQLEIYIDEEIKRSDRHRLPLAIIMFDIDYFKHINDRYGHAIGDLVLVKTARLVRNSLRSTDRFGRWGGDEFVCVATNTDEDTANFLAERLRKELEQAHILNSSPITCSFGVTRFVSGDSTDDLIRRADLGLFRAKANGRNQVNTISPDATLPV
ncbi:MAG: hypothetical protein A2X25_05465 [Chloroflexi bacterium GWB2_49_20]|nr:MAG: hypothetical protein A2X25_05465 [Chloroflexi bacterium GWB2_49_20]OGN77074.1 MAG: hypothetical protein A2X26_06465 [Chloroflexi bacterium GWC2_49_37]OGN83800.1 MAG: hypothetical protein A2X27_02065 [Chloroflexi bacterium GWD2_49_16]HCM96878.1 hypothetical protein [Anaerolineae bacterium]